jgi:hypothetical protein
MVVEAENRFPKFERWIEKEYPSVYEEEIYHRSEWPIGVLLATFGLYPWILSNFALGPIQIVGLGASLFGIIVIIAGLVRYRLKLEHYRYHGLTRKTISDAITSLDAYIVKSVEIVSPAPYHGETTLSSYDRAMKRSDLIKLIRNTSGLIEWPSDFIVDIKKELEREHKGFRRCSVTTLVVLLLSLSIVYYLISSEVLLVWVFFVPLMVCFGEMIFGYLQYLNNHSYLFQDDWLQNALTSNSIQLDETMNRILNLLHFEFQFPLRFYLGREYSLLNYTGRTKTTYTLARLKEAVLYPRNIPP